MKITLSERQKCVLAATATLHLLILYPLLLLIYVPKTCGLLTGELLEIAEKIELNLFWPVLILNIMLGAIITKKKEYLFELWCFSSIISALSPLCVFVQYIIVSRNDRGKWAPIDFILMAIAGCVFYFGIHHLDTFILVANLF